MLRIGDSLFGLCWGAIGWYCVLATTIVGSVRDTLYCSGLMLAAAGCGGFFVGRYSSRSVSACALGFSAPFAAWAVFCLSLNSLTILMWASNALGSMLMILLLGTVGRKQRGVVRRETPQHRFEVLTVESDQKQERKR